MSGINAANITPHSPPLLPHLTPHALQHFVNTHGPGLPKEFQPHSQVLDLLRNSTPNQHRQDVLADFIKESNEARRNDKHVPKFSSVTDKDMEDIQKALGEKNTTAIHTLMRKKRWKTLTLILGDEVVTLCRPKVKTGVMRYVRNRVDKTEDDKDTHSGQLLELDAQTLETLAGQLMQQSAPQGVTSGTTDPNAADPNAIAPSDALRADPNRTSVTAQNSPQQTNPSGVHQA